MLDPLGLTLVSKVVDATDKDDEVPTGSDDPPPLVLTGIEADEAPNEPVPTKVGIGTETDEASNEPVPAEVSTDDT